jgi:hypothetical protein
MCNKCSKYSFITGEKNMTLIALFFHTVGEPTNNTIVHNIIQRTFRDDKDLRVFIRSVQVGKGRWTVVGGILCFVCCIQDDDQNFMRQRSRKDYRKSRAEKLFYRESSGIFHAHTLSRGILIVPRMRRSVVRLVEDAKAVL